MLGAPCNGLASSMLDPVGIGGGRHAYRVFAVILHVMHCSILHIIMGYAQALIMDDLCVHMAAPTPGWTEG